MPVKTIEWAKGRIRIIDQTKLPNKVYYKEINTVGGLWRAIKKLEVRGAPAIGAAGALGVVLAANKERTSNAELLRKRVAVAIKYLSTSRPTAVNLFWALERMNAVLVSNKGITADRMRKRLLSEAIDIMEEDKRICRQMAVYGAGLIKKGERILTHCNAGALATVDYGTALGVLFKAHEERKNIKVFADETRPLLQGARLTCWELMREGIDVTLICDNMAASLMKKGMIDSVFVGSDRVAANGDAANKIGTYNLAVLAAYHKIPFYVVCPLSTFDAALETGRDIPIEERGPDEVRCILGRMIAPKKVKTYNPAFDVTPSSLIKAIITERGVIKPTKKAIRTLLEG